MRASALPPLLAAFALAAPPAPGHPPAPHNAPAPALRDDAPRWTFAGGQRWDLQPIPGAFTITWAPGVVPTRPGDSPLLGPDSLKVTGLTLSRVGRLASARYHTQRYELAPAPEPPGARPSDTAAPTSPEALAAALRARPDVAAASPVYKLVGADDRAWRAATDLVIAQGDRDRIVALAAAHGWAYDGPFGSTPDQHVLRAADPVAAAMALHRDPAVAWAQADWIEPRSPRFLPDDPRFEDQWHLLNEGQGGGVAGNDLDLPAAWDRTLGEGVVLAVLDSGIDADHPEYDGALLPGWDVLDGDSDPDPGSASSHGTRVTGVAAAPANGVGVVGTCPACSIIPVRMLGASNAGEAEAIHYAVDNGAWVINNSWGPPDGLGQDYPLPPVVEAAIDHAVEDGRDGLGTVIFWASGNGHPVDSCSMDGYVSHPATIAVGASTDAGVVSSFSERCPELDLSAPSAGGSSALTTTTLYNPNDPDSGYTSNFGGTSGATPGAAGVGALLLAVYPSLRWDELRALLRATADPIDAETFPYDGGRNDTYGWGRIDAASAVAGQLAFFSATERLACDGTLELRLNRPLEPGLAPTATLTSSLDQQTVALLETEPGLYEASVELGAGLAVADVDTVTSEVDGLSSALTEVDCDSPGLLTIEASGVTPYRARIDWTFDEPATSRLTWAEASAEPSDDGLTDTHGLNLLTLVPCSDYAFSVEGTDAVGNRSTFPDAVLVSTPGDPAFLPPEAPEGADPCDWEPGTGDDDDLTPPDPDGPRGPGDSCSDCSRDQDGCGGPGAFVLLLPLLGWRRQVTTAGTPPSRPPPRR